MRGFYLNGKQIGTHAIGAIDWDQPFAIAITEQVRRDDENVLVVLVWDMGGAGGIFRPVWLVTPAGSR